MNAEPMTPDSPENSAVVGIDVPRLVCLSDKWEADMNAIWSGRACDAPSEFFRDHNHFNPQLVIQECKRQLDEIISEAELAIVSR